MEHLLTGLEVFCLVVMLFLPAATYWVFHEPIESRRERAVFGGLVAVGAAGLMAYSTMASARTARFDKIRQNEITLLDAGDRSNYVSLRANHGLLQQSINGGSWGNLVPDAGSGGSLYVHWGSYFIQDKDVVGHTAAIGSLCISDGTCLVDAVGNNGSGVTKIFLNKTSARCAYENPNCSATFDFEEALKAVRHGSIIVIIPYGQFSNSPTDLFSTNAAGNQFTLFKALGVPDTTGDAYSFDVQFLASNRSNVGAGQNSSVFGVFPARGTPYNFLGMSDIARRHFFPGVNLGSSIPLVVNGEDYLFDNTDKTLYRQSSGDNLSISPPLASDFPLKDSGSLMDASHDFLAFSGGSREAVPFLALKSSVTAGLQTLSVAGINIGASSLAKPVIDTPTLNNVLRIDHPAESRQRHVQRQSPGAAGDIPARALCQADKDWRRRHIPGRPGQQRDRRDADWQHGFVRLFQSQLQAAGRRIFGGRFSRCVERRDPTLAGDI